MLIELWLRYVSHSHEKVAQRVTKFLHLNNKRKESQSSKNLNDLYIKKPQLKSVYHNSIKKTLRYSEN